MTTTKQTSTAQLLGPTHLVTFAEAKGSLSMGAAEEEVTELSVKIAVGLVIGGGAIVFGFHVLATFIGNHPALENLGLILMGTGTGIVSFTNYRHHRKRTHMLIAILSIGWVLMAAFALMKALGVIR